MSIFGRIDGYAAADMLRMHTPGHKGRLDPRDVTEIEEVFPLDAVETAEAEAARAYGVPHLRFLTGGSSAGVKAAILSAPGPILAENISHRSVAEGAARAGKNLGRLTRPLSAGLHVPPTADEGLAAARACGAGTVVLTSPDYYGRVVDDGVFAAVKAAGYTLIVDGAHGAHFAFSPLFPTPPCRFADLCNMSAHKTLGAYTQSAFLAVNDPAYLAAADRALKLIGTTSPSYILLGGLEAAVTAAAGAGARYAELYEAITCLKKAFVFAANDDFTRLVLDGAAYGTGGAALYRALLEHGAAAEKFDERYVVFIVTHYDTADDIRRLGKILKEVL